MTDTADPTDMQLFAGSVVQQLREAGFMAYFAGGCVRDSLLHRVPKDFDVATDAKPDQVRWVFGRKRTLAIGASFGVITVLGPKPHQVEVATFRNDGEYTDGRHPDGVTFSTAEEDTARRDFTINGMFYDPIHDEVIDYVGGQADLAAKRIRAIGEPSARIEEDRLRMLRAVRFASTYGFEIEQQTLTAIREHADKITVVSQERITAELCQMLDHPSRGTALSLLLASNLLRFVFPSLDAMIQRDSVAWTKLLAIVSSGHLKNTTQAMSVLLGHNGANLTPQEADAVCRRMKFSNEKRKTIHWIISNRSRLEQVHEMKFSEVQPLLVQDPIHNALGVMRADARASTGPAIRRCEDFLKLDETQRNPAVLLRGEDLKQLGIQPGPRFKELLDSVRAAQLDGLIATKSEAVTWVTQRLN